MTDSEIINLVAAFNTKDSPAREGVWEQLRDVRERVFPYFAELFPRAKQFEVRRDIAYHCIRFARSSEIAFRIGLMAVEDRSRVVRYRGCSILAYSLRADALPALKKQLTHADVKTVEDVKAAIDAIEHRNHHFFVDRQHTGQMFWAVDDGGTVELDNNTLQRTGAADMLSKVRKWLARGLGR
jgi:hypothetical protein